MLYQIAIGVGGMVILVSLYVIFNQLAFRMRALNGDCQMSSLRCLGCLATGRCGQQERQTERERRRNSRPGAPGRP